MGIFNFFKKQDDFGKSLVEQEQQNKEKSELLSKEFQMVIEDIFFITGRGIIVTGNITSGSVCLNDTLTIKETGIQTKVVGIEQFRKKCDIAQAGENVGVLLDGISKDCLKEGYTLIK